MGGGRQRVYYHIENAVIKLRLQMEIDCSIRITMHTAGKMFLQACEDSKDLKVFEKLRARCFTLPLLQRERHLPTKLYNAIWTLFVEQR